MSSSYPSVKFIDYISMLCQKHLIVLIFKLSSSSAKDQLTCEHESLQEMRIIFGFTSFLLSLDEHKVKSS